MNLPALRFTAPDGTPPPKWQTKKLGEVAIRVKEKNKFNNLNVLTISAQHGLINQLQYFKHSVSAKDLTGYYIINKNDFAYNRSYSKGYPTGAIKRLKYYECGVVSTLYICLKFIENKSVIYFDYYFCSGYQNHFLYKITQEGARNHGLLNMSIEDFFDMPIPLPSLPEQEKIANALTAVDDKITALKDKTAHYQAFKKGLMQQLFPQS